MTKNGKKWRILTTKNGLKTYFRWVFGHVWTEFFMLVNLPPTLIMNYIFLGQKSSIDFSPHFSPFYPDRLTSESYNNPLKVIPEGSMVEYLPVGSKEGPQTIIGKKKKFKPQIPKSHSQPSVHCTHCTSVAQLIKALNLILRFEVHCNNETKWYTKWNSIWVL